MTTLVGRDAELNDAVRSLVSGRGVLLAGPAGVGKTALAGAVAELLPKRFGTVWIRATEASRQIPFGALGPLLPADLGSLHPAVVPEFVAARLRERGGGQPGVLIVDDAQLLDDSSAATVLALVAGSGVAVLGTLRTGSATSDAITALWKENLLDRMDLDPLTRTDTRTLLEQRLGGQVASGTVELLWTRSQGNALYLNELIRFGTETARLVERAGVWLWAGGQGAGGHSAGINHDVPPRLGELLQRRLDELSPAARDALDLLALGAPLPYDTLAAIVAPEAILEIDERAVVTSDERDGTVTLRFAHPLLHSVSERRLTPARRRTLAARLRTAPAENVDLVRRAIWDEAAAEEPDVELLLSAADAVLLTDPRTSIRFAERALEQDSSPRAAIALSAALAEAGEPGPARVALEVARSRVRTEDEWLSTGLEGASLALWSDRDPSAALAAVDALRSNGRTGIDDELDTVQSLIELFSARTGSALLLSDRALERGLAPSPLVRALMVRLGALTMTERSRDVLDAVAQLQSAMAEIPMGATRYGLAHALIALARLFHGQGLALPAMVGTSGRWPTGPSGLSGLAGSSSLAGSAGSVVSSPGAAPSGLGGVVRAAASSDAEPPSDAARQLEPAAAWPLLVGVRNHVEGDWPAATAALREAFVQQTSGEGLFRSEAAGSLVVVLAEAGHREEAARILDQTPPDAVALIPGLHAWAEAAIAGAGRPSSAAGALAIRAAEQAAAAGALPTALWYLADAARFGPARAAARALEELRTGWQSPLAQARVAGIQARASGRPANLVEAAERHAALGLFGHAAELAELAASRTSGSRRGEGGQSLATRAAAVLRRAQVRLGPRSGTQTVLTDREFEIARLAAAGMSDRMIADSLVVSVRTVESHLGSAYRKLGIDSRRALADALPG